MMLAKALALNNHVWKGNLPVYFIPIQSDDSNIDHTIKKKIVFQKLITDCC